MQKKNHEGKRPLEGRRPRWEDNIKMNLKEISGWLWTGFMRLRAGSRGGIL
jgi:hypothetical protein